MKELLAIVFIALIGLMIVLRMAVIYRRGKQLAKYSPIQLKPRDKIVYVPDMYNQQNAEVLIHKGTNVRIRITERESFGKQLIVDRSKCHLRRDEV